MKKQVILNVASREAKVQCKDMPQGGICVAMLGGTVLFLRYLAGKGYYWARADGGGAVSVTGSPFMDSQIRDGHRSSFEKAIHDVIKDGRQVFHYDSLSEAYRDLADYCKKQEAQDT